jgi:uncharacterized membrane protein (UPF0136 family)
MAAATVSGACLCRFYVSPASHIGPVVRNDVRFAQVSPFLVDGGKTGTDLHLEKDAIRSSFWGRTAAFQRCVQNRQVGLQKSRGCSGGALQAQAVSQETASVWTAVYGLLLLGGGTSAYLRSGSKQSVISGALGAALSATAFYLEGQESTHQTGLALAFGYSLLFASVFGIRLFATKKPFPAAPLLALSLASAFVFASAYSA